MIIEAHINFYPADRIRHEHLEEDWNPQTIVPQDILKGQIDIEIKEANRK